MARVSRSLALVKHLMIKFLHSNSARLRALALAFLSLAASAAVARSETAPPPRVQVAWAPVEQLREVKDNQMDRGWLRPEQWMQMLGDHLRQSADRVLSPGQQLRVTIDDIKLAGAFEPWRGPGLQDARILKEIYPPSMELHYKLLAADGTTIREREAELRDASYLQRSMPYSTDPLRYDKRMIDEWLWREFGRPKP